MISACGASALKARKLQTIGAQLYTVRNILPDKPHETLQAIEKIGYREVEVVGATMATIWPALKQTKLRAVSVHLDTLLFTRNQEKLIPALEDAKQRGLQYVVCPYIDPRDRGGADVIRKLGETLTTAGEKCRAMGISLCYHNHAFEFEPSGSGTLLDVLMKASDPKLVSLEFDIMWSQVAGVDPVSVLKQYGGRIALMHLKNVAPGTPKQYKEPLPPTAFKEVGNGTIDIRAVLRAAAPYVKHYFVEQDQAPGNPVDSLRQSMEYLRNLDF